MQGAVFCLQEGNFSPLRRLIRIIGTTDHCLPEILQFCKQHINSTLAYVFGGQYTPANGGLFRRLFQVA
jgi:hypothetical protein